MKKKYTNCFVEERYGKVIATMKATFKNAVTEEEARAEGVREETEKGYLKYLGILNVDITAYNFRKLTR
jgi:hypothetical protein